MTFYCQNNGQTGFEILSLDTWYAVRILIRQYPLGPQFSINGGSFATYALDVGGPPVRYIRIGHLGDANSEVRMFGLTFSTTGFVDVLA